MVRQLMLFARSEASACKTAVNVAAVVERTLSICRGTFDRRITIEMNAENDLPPVLARAGELEQVLLNVCINARDALEETYRDAPRIELHLERGSDHTVRIRILDNGPGMDEATRSRLFEPFFTTKEVGRGTGLGLASAYGIVLDHRGTFRCRSAPGAGTEFIIELPIADYAAVPTPVPCTFPNSRGDETILLVDDEPLVRRALSALLRDAGFHVIEASDGREGLAMIQTQAIDLVVLDRLMPQMSGDELLRKLRVARPNLPAIILTGHPSADVEVNDLVAVITKPPRSQNLFRTIRDILDQAAARPRLQ